jgi:hypothetical protein
LIPSSFGCNSSNISSTAVSSSNSISPPSSVRFHDNLSLLIYILQQNIDQPLTRTQLIDLIKLYDPVKYNYYRDRMSELCELVVDSIEKNLEQTNLQLSLQGYKIVRDEQNQTIKMVTNKKIKYNTYKIQIKNIFSCLMIILFHIIFFKYICFFVLI